MRIWPVFLLAGAVLGADRGPAIGAKAPDFHLPDQNGKPHNLQELMGPKGLMLVFYRSADW